MRSQNYTSDSSFSRKQTFLKGKNLTFYEIIYGSLTEQNFSQYKLDIYTLNKKITHTLTYRLVFGSSGRNCSRSALVVTTIQCYSQILSLPENIYREKNDNPKKSQK